MKLRVLSIISIAILITVSFIGGCFDSDIKKTDDTSDQPTQYFAINEVVNSSNLFSFEMYKQLLNGTDNVFFSPYSITIALGMAYEGAKGETASQIQDVIDFPEDDKTRRDMVRSLQTLLNPESALYDISTANAYWLQQGGYIKEEYRNTIENDYRADGTVLDMMGNPVVSADIINNWVENETNGKIEKLLIPDLVAVAYLILTNAIYFKSDWKYQFDPDATEKEDFHLSSGGKISVDMMNMCDDEIELNYSEDEDTKMLQLPYKGNALSMYVLLPKDSDISSIEQNLDKEYLDELKSDMNGEWVDVRLPKFKYEKSEKLKEKLSNMGMVEAFTPGADFTGINDGKLWIEEVVHKSFVEVNEEGTEAAAATAVVMTISADNPTPKDFRADHPFIFLIEHKDTGQILFMGKVEVPSI